MCHLRQYISSVEKLKTSTLLSTWMPSCKINLAMSEIYSTLSYGNIWHICRIYRWNIWKYVYIIVWVIPKHRHMAPETSHIIDSGSGRSHARPKPVVKPMLTSFSNLEVNCNQSTHILFTKMLLKMLSVRILTNGYSLERNQHSCQFHQYLRDTFKYPRNLN